MLFFVVGCDVMDVGFDGVEGVAFAAVVDVVG
jgi:hypothetical protein